MRECGLFYAGWIFSVKKKHYRVYSAGLSKSTERARHLAYVISRNSLFLSLQ